MHIIILKMHNTIIRTFSLTTCDRSICTLTQLTFAILPTAYIIETHQDCIARQRANFHGQTRARLRRQFYFCKKSMKLFRRFKQFINT